MRVRVFGVNTADEISLKTLRGRRTIRLLWPRRGSRRRAARSVRTRHCTSVSVSDPYHGGCVWGFFSRIRSCFHARYNENIARRSPAGGGVRPCARAVRIVEIRNAGGTSQRILRSCASIIPISPWPDRIENFYRKNETGQIILIESTLKKKNKNIFS